MKKSLIFWASVLAVLYFYFPFIVSAAPSVASFDASPASGSSGYPYSFVWTLNDAGGSSLVIPCADGIKAGNANTGAEIVCDTKLSSSAASSGGLLLQLINISGVSKTILVKLIPKDTSGVLQDALAKTVSVSISPSAQVVEFFRSSTTTTETGKAVTLSWNIPDAWGANISMECKDGVRATSPNYSSGNLPCGRQIFSTALGKTASLAINFVNSSIDAIPVSFTLYPAIGTNIYNGINTESFTINVASDVVPDPAVNYFKTSSPLAVLSGENIKLSWDTENTKGVNLKISCADSITATSSVEPGVNLPCDKYALMALLGSDGNVSLAFQNKSAISKNVTVTLYPAFKNKEGYDATKSKSLAFEIKPVGFVAPSPSLITAPIQTPMPTPTQSSSSPAGLEPIAPTSAPSPTPTVKATPTPTVKAAPKPAATTVKIAPTASPQLTPEPTGIQEVSASPETTHGDFVEIDSSPKLKNEQEIADYLIGKGQVDEVKSAALNSTENIYDIRGLRNVKLFYVIPVKIKVTLKVDAMNGSVKETHFAWWSFLVRW